MSECHGCKAAADVLTHSYGAGCTQCSARALAQSPEFAESQVRNVICADYQAGLERVFGTSVKDQIAGHKMVCEWNARIMRARFAQMRGENV